MVDSERASPWWQSLFGALFAALVSACGDDAGEVHAEVVTELLGLSYRIDQYTSTHNAIPATVASVFREERFDVSVVTDPWGSEYKYVTDSENPHRYRLFTLGEGGVSGGCGICSDVVLWVQAGHIHIGSSVHQPPWWW